MQTFSKDELRKAFDKADLDGDGVINCRALAMAVQGLGSCVLGSAPTAAAANAVPEDERAGALALLRVCGDLGLLTGSAGFGALAAAAGSDAAFGAASVLLVGTAARFRYLAPSK